MKILYLFSGDREKVLRNVANGVDPDTQLYGYNHISRGGVEVETMDFSNILPIWLGKLLGFRLRHLLIYFITPKYDIVFGSSILYFMVFRNILKPKTNYFLLNTALNRLLVVHRNHSLQLRFIKWMIRGIKKVVCLSNFQLNQLSDEFGIEKEKLVFVPLGVDIDYYKPVFEGRKEYYLSVGRDNGRDYKTVLEVAMKMPEKKFEIICSKRNVENIGHIPGNVTIIFDISKEELKKKYEEAKVLLLLTHNDSHNEGSDCSGQTVLLDAGASGLPIIASRKKYIEDYFEDKKEVFLANFYDSEDVVRSIDELGKKNLSVNIAKAARSKVERLFSTKRMADNLVCEFEKLS